MKLFKRRLKVDKGLETCLSLDDIGILLKDWSNGKDTGEVFNTFMDYMCKYGLIDDAWDVFANTNKINHTFCKCKNGKFNFNICILELNGKFRVAFNDSLYKIKFNSVDSALRWFNKTLYNGSLIIKKI